MRTLTLSATVNIALNGSGNGTVQAGPVSPGEVWYPAVVSVSVATNTNEAQCKIYSGAIVAPFTFIDGTVDGSTGDSTDRVTGKVLRPGQYIFAQWTGGDAGSTATLNISGTRQVP
jgi:hypothetical protein